jgi:tRNA modification GTPase
MPKYASDTICAIITPPGTGAISAIRLSGSDAVSIAKTLFLSGKSKKTLDTLEHRKVYYGYITDKQAGQDIDEVLMLVMLGPNSYTGDDVVELHTHGNSYIAENILQILYREGCRAAKAGEFTQRAFMAGKIDITQAEAIADLINNKSKLSNTASIQQLEGKLKQTISELTGKLKYLLSRLEACIDFPDEIDMLPTNDLDNALNEYIIDIDKLLSKSSTSKLIRDGVSVAIVGLPNAGKSSLLNRILGEERAIVTDIAGTTRDVINETVSVKGININIIDTAGIRHSTDTVEKIGIERSRKAITESDLAILVVDAGDADNSGNTELYELVKEKKHIIAMNKTDMYPQMDEQPFIPTKTIKISAATGAGIDTLLDTIYDMAVDKNTDISNMPYILNSRHISSLNRARSSLLNCLEAVKANREADILTIDIKQAVLELTHITGENLSEEVMNEIFNNFCVGK